MKCANGLLMVLVALLPAAASAREGPESRPAAPISDIRDTAGLFGPDAGGAARRRLREIEAEFKVPTIVETIDSLKGKTVDDVAVALARRSGMSGIFVLIAKRETKIEVLPSHRVESALPRARRNAIRAAFIEKFRKKDFDSGLKQGVEAIATALKDAAHDDKLPAAEIAEKKRPSDLDPIPSLTARKSESTAEAAREFGGKPAGGGRSSNLIVRDQIGLTLDGARLVIDGARRQAESMKLNVNISVVDDGGHPLAFARMDGARPASAYTAMTKAITAATYRQPTGPSPVGTTQPDVLLNLSLQNAAAASGGKITTLFGGLPILVDGQVIGGVGVGGGTGEQDKVIGKAGIDHFLEAIKGSTPPQEKAAPESKPKVPESKPKEEKPATSEVKTKEDGDF